jgi:hypothetical protein
MPEFPSRGRYGAADHGPIGDRGGDAPLAVMAPRTMVQFKGRIFTACERCLNDCLLQTLHQVFSWNYDICIDFDINT